MYNYFGCKEDALECFVKTNICYHVVPEKSPTSSLTPQIKVCVCIIFPVNLLIEKSLLTSSGQIKVFTSVLFMHVVLITSNGRENIDVMISIRIIYVYNGMINKIRSQAEKLINKISKKVNKTNNNNI